MTELLGGRRRSSDSSSDRKARDLVVAGLLSLARLAFIALTGALGALVAYITAVRLGAGC